MSATASAGSETFTSSGGATIFEQWWRPAPEAKAVLAICHGYAEHSGRYAQVAADLNARGYVVEALDLRGHGQSSGARVTVNSYDEFWDDLDHFLERVRGRNPGKKLFLLGHSMGGGVVTSYVLARKRALDGVLLSGAAMLGPRPQRAPDAAARRTQPLPALAVALILSAPSHHNACSFGLLERLGWRKVYRISGARPLTRCGGAARRMVRVR
jgi:alpha-beta hydrolase superfamily lysophospholipase